MSHIRIRVNGVDKNGTARKRASEVAANADNDTATDAHHERQKPQRAIADNSRPPRACKNSNTRNFPKRRSANAAKSATATTSDKNSIIAQFLVFQSPFDAQGEIGLH